MYSKQCSIHILIEITKLCPNGCYFSAFLSTDNRVPQRNWNEADVMAKEHLRLDWNTQCRTIV